MFGYFLISVIYVSSEFGSCYKILGVVPAPPYSHFTLGFRIMKELADRGHEVTFINSHPQKVPINNVRDISVEDIKSPVNTFVSQLMDFGKLSYIEQMEWVVQMGIVKSKLVFQNKNVQDLMKSNETFDLVIVNHFFSDAFAYFAHRFNCPLILLAPFSTNVFNNHIFGNPAPPSFVTHFLTDYSSNMNFWQRLENTYRQLVGEVMVHYRMIYEQNKVLQEVFPDAPDLSTILYNTSLMLSVSDVSLGDPLPLQQNIKEIGGYHVLPPKRLPKDLQEFMDNCTEAVIVFSMGSNLKSSDFAPEKRRAILNVLSKIKQKVLWKFEADLPEKPDNVKIMKWMPQSDLLAHPNTVAFISHGGLLGTTEAVYHGVPILGLPVFWDQIKNIGTAVRKGFALSVNFHHLEEKSFSEALNKILYDPIYTKKAKEFSSIMHDRPIKQIDEAIFWIEYVIRHQGAPHLRSAALNLRWYQLYSLDIILFICIIVTVIFIICRAILRCIIQEKKIRDTDKKNK